MVSTLREDRDDATRDVRAHEPPSLPAVADVNDVLKRLVIGRALRSDRLGETLLPKRIALPVFASDALSSVAYAPDEIFLTLSIAGLAAYSFSWKIGLVVVLVMLTVVASYRQNVHAYPSGGGDYEVATVNLGPKYGLTVAAALLVDYVLTVAVSISSGVQNAAAALPFVEGHEAPAAVALVLLLTAINLRGVKESGAAFAIPTYGFMIAILGMTLFGLARYAFGDLPDVESARYTLAPEEGFEEGFTGLAAGFLLLRTFSSGCAALTGVEAISNGVPAFQKPKSKNAATTLLLMGTVAVTMLMGIITLGNVTGLRFAEFPEEQLLLDGVPVGAGYTQDTVISQLASAVYSDARPLFFITVAFTGVILVLAANTAFNGFPVLGSILAKDGYLPRQLHTRGDRLAYSNGIVLLAGFAIVLIVAYDAKVTQLIQLYIVGVFISFTLSQTGMIRHWTRLLAREKDPKARARMRRSRAINAFGLLLTATVLVIVLITKFTRGAYIALIAMAVLFVLMRGIKSHYDTVRAELEPEDTDLPLPSRNHAVVLVSKIHAPTLRALAYAKATRPHDLTALTVAVDAEEARGLQDEWDRSGLDVPLTVVASPYREITAPILEYVRDYRRSSPRDVVTVFIPEYVVGRWWEQLLHNQSALRLKGRLLFVPGVMVTSVPYQLRSSDRRRADDDPTASPGSVRRPGT
ncbi:MAG: DNA-binding protein [Frankiales bacterium]|nr:DNA-binding protein [Frankiales bacterium]